MNDLFTGGQGQTTAFVSAPVPPYPTEIPSDVPPGAFWFSLALAALMGRDYIWNHWGGKELLQRMKQDIETIPKPCLGDLFANACSFVHDQVRDAKVDAFPLVDQAPTVAQALPVAPVRKVIAKPREYTMGEWRYLASQPGGFIKGIQGSGKTTVARAIMNERGGLALIFNPKRSPKDWGDGTLMPAVIGSRKFDWTEVKSVLVDLEGEVARRASLDAAALEAEPVLTIVLDDLPVLARACQKELSDFLGVAAMIGRSMKIYLLLIGQSDRAELTGTKGMHDVLTGLPRLAMRDRQGTLTYGEEVTKVDMRGAWEASQGQRWQTVTSVKPTAVEASFESETV